jgi:hypothetical protein
VIMYAEFDNSLKLIEKDKSCLTTVLRWTP